MADVQRYGEDKSNYVYADIEPILLEAQHRWLRPAEICEILRNFRKFRIAPEPTNRPRSGTLFLYDRKVLRNFRKDGHNWRKKKDGKTVKEAHERLKAGSIEVLHCYYAHGEENESFGRRICWMFEEELSHIVLVHYLEVKDVDLKSSYERNHFQSSEDASDQESIEELSVEVINSSTQNNFDTYQIDLATKSPPWTHDLLNVGGLQLAVDDDTIKNGNGVISAGKSYFTATDLVQKGKINATKMEHTKNETSISYEVLKGHFGMKLEDAAEELGVSRSKLKRLCRQFEIDRWPSHKRNKVNHPLFDHDPSSSNPPTNQAIKDGRTATIKAAYRDDIIMFQLSFSSRMIDLEEEVRKRLKLDIGTFKIKYEDEDGDRILLACDADLKNYIRILTSSGKTIKLLVELLEPRTLA